ncbi:hypothetical protein ILYODFUR_031462 [Ilyodon furcidens]|uniref:Uncharacterized protein n=1 Tax=Ilyodon furcidens TaxID=33524 RepID=A0ABV0UY55_9TELE
MKTSFSLSSALCSSGKEYIATGRPDAALLLGWILHLHSTTSRTPRGKDISNFNPKIFIQAHVILSVRVFLRGPSAKEINICK